MLIEKIADFLNKIGLKKQSEFLRACCLEGSKLSGSKNSNSLINTLKGVFCFFKEPGFKEKINKHIRIALIYQDSTVFEKFLTTIENSQTKIVAKLITKNNLKKRELKILDMGCHYGYLIDDIKQYPQLTIDRYTGVDLSFDVIEKAKLRVKNRFGQVDSLKYSFILGNGLNEDLYKELPSDNNIIVFSGLGHLNSREIKFLLSNSNKVISKEENSRIYLSNTVFEEHIPKVHIYSKKLLSYFKWVCEKMDVVIVPGIESFIEKASQKEVDSFVDKLCKESFETKHLEDEGIEEGVFYRLYRSNDPKFNYEFNTKDRCQFDKFLINCGFEIDIENSFINPLIIGLAVDYLCLKKKS